MTLSCFDDLALETVSIPIGGREWHLECVRDQGRVLAYAESHAQAPYGLLLWESAVALARSLHTRSTLVENKQVLELGAGVGLPGLVARSLGAEVWQTDNLTAALEIARLNARANEVGGITQFTADWTRWTDDRTLRRHSGIGHSIRAGDARVGRFHLPPKSCARWLCTTCGSSAAAVYRFIGTSRGRRGAFRPGNNLR